MSLTVRLQDSVTVAQPFQIPITRRRRRRRSSFDFVNALQESWTVLEVSRKIEINDLVFPRFAGISAHQPEQASLIAHSDFQQQANQYFQYAVHVLTTFTSARNDQFVIAVCDLPRWENVIPEQRDRLSWLSELRDRIDSFAGKWIAIGDSGLLAVEDTAMVALEKARNAGEHRPLLHHVPTSDHAGGFGF